MKGILFSADMANAIYEGRKTTTRRPIKGASYWWILHPFSTGGVIRDLDSGKLSANFNIGDGDPYYGRTIDLPYKLGDVLYVKESWQAGSEFDNLSPAKIPIDAKINYLASPKNGEWGKARSSLFMCEHQARMRIKIINVYVQRLNQISPIEATFEGFQSVNEFEQKWESLYGKGEFDKRWVCVIDFELIKAEE